MIAIVLVAILVPEFGRVMSLLGAGSAFLLCIIGPIAAKMLIEESSGWVGVMDWILLVVASIMAAWGTAAAFAAG